MEFLCNKSDKNPTLAMVILVCFSCIACDHVIEQTCYRVSRAMWAISSSKCAAIEGQCEVMAGGRQDIRIRKDIDQTRRARDGKDVQAITYYIYNSVFSRRRKFAEHQFCWCQSDALPAASTYCWIIGYYWFLQLAWYSRLLNFTNLSSRRNLNSFRSRENKTAQVP